MYSNKLSALRTGRTHSIFNAIACVILSSAPLALVGAPAQAGESADAARHMVVSFKDLNLSSTEGVTALYRRIKGAAQQVCEAWDTSRLSQAQAQACVNAAVSRAVVQINSPLLTSLYRAQFGNAAQETTLAQAH
jgi:UrcA family protein